MKIAFLINNAYGIGGTIRATANMSGALAARHEVEVVSVHRTADRTGLPFDPRVRMTTLIDLREDSPDYAGDHPLTERPNTMYNEGSTVSGRQRYTALHDERLSRYLAGTDADVVIATRPILNGYLARYGTDRYLRVGQEHLSLAGHADQVLRDQNVAIGQLDAYVTVSEADAAAYRAALPQVRTLITCVPNGVPAGRVQPSTRDSKVIVAAGRLITVKRYDRLVDAFAKVADAHPDWTLRLYGRGPKRDELREQIDALGLYERIYLMGSASPIETEWAKGAIAAVSSDMESFGMTIVEAMHCGVPVVATDCPHGPAEIIEHGKNGLLVPKEDGEAGIQRYADALDRLMSDAALRDAMGEAARIRAADFEPDVVARRYEELFRVLTARRTPEPPRVERLDARRRPRLFRRPKAAALVQAPAPAVAAAPAPAPDKPLAYVRSTADGGFTVRFETATLPSGPLDFVARLRKDPKGREIRVPLPDAAAQGPDGRAVTLSPAEHVLATGRWDCYVARRGTNKRQRLICGLAERAARVGAAPHTGPDGVSAWQPYPTVDGFLALRTWHRAAHAEVERVEIGEESATFRAVLLGDGAGLDGARVVAVSRAGDGQDFSVPVTPGTGGGFTFTLPYADAAGRRRAERDYWDLRLHRATGEPAPVPVGRLGGDIVDRNKTDLFPEGGGHGVKVYVTMASDFAVCAREVER
ncbi:glycosyltransferase family 4 protein [Streptomyces sp. NPDC046939]|uniref:glycosyltransferase family 4 protein n=1 Tax=Streptomyces sp. NPDC046939 TaxID=3155376 RepID=UPI00340EB623